MAKVKWCPFKTAAGYGSHDCLKDECELYLKGKGCSFKNMSKSLETIATYLTSIGTSAVEALNEYTFSSKKGRGFM